MYLYQAQRLCVVHSQLLEKTLVYERLVLMLP